ncbi:MAG: hypothetical protein QM479_14410 [Pseudomonadota bacterium]
MIIILYFLLFLMGPAFAGPLQLIDYQAEQSPHFTDKDSFNASIINNDIQREKIKEKILIEIISGESAISSKGIQLNRKNMSMEELKNLLESDVEKGIDKLKNKFSNALRNVSEEDNNVFFDDTSDEVVNELKKETLLSDKDIDMEIKKFNKEFDTQRTFADSNFQKIVISTEEQQLKVEKTQQFNDKFVLVVMALVLLFFLYNFLTFLTRNRE